jgi:Uri superfamily endonuclease
MADAGTYVLALFMPRGKTIRIGALGNCSFPRGWYIYVGSAMNGLAARVKRHLRQEKKLFWHIDYFRVHATVVAVEKQMSRTRLECRSARRVLESRGARVIVPGFGSSDCDCLTHLIHFDRLPDLIFDSSRLK